MRELGIFLAERGVTAHGVLLAGHGTTPADLARTQWQDWVASAQMGLQRLQSTCTAVILVGISGGGTLALYLAARERVAGVVAISAPVFFRDWRMTLIPLLKYVVRSYAPTDCDLVDPTAREQYYRPPATYQEKPLAAVEQMVRLARAARVSLPQVTVPTLLIYGRRDRTIALENASYIFQHIGARIKELVWYEHSGHGLIVDAEKQAVWRCIADFVRRCEG
jgi:carboxylesterase